VRTRSGNYFDALLLDDVDRYGGGGEDRKADSQRDRSLLSDFEPFVRVNTFLR